MSEQVIDDILSESGQLDESFWSDYENAQAFVGNPVPGAYTLRIPSLPESSFKVQNDGSDGRAVNPNINGGRPYLEITLDSGQDGCTIVGGEFDGAQVRYLRVDTKRIPVYKNRKPTGTFSKATTATDVLANFGTRDTIASVDDFKAAFRRLEGQETPNPVRLTYGGYDKNAQGKAKYLRAKDFPKGQTYVERVATAPFVTKKGVTVNAGDTYRVYANLTTAYRGFSPMAE